MVQWLIEDRTLQELMDQFKTQVEENIYNKQQQGNINYNQWKEHRPINEWNTRYQEVQNIEIHVV